MASDSVSMKYNITGWDVGDKDFTLEVRVNTSVFFIGVSSDSFKRSPDALQNFDKNLDCLRDGDDAAEELWAYLDWIMQLYLPQFEALAPPVTHTGKLTLADVLYVKTYEGELKVVDEQVITGTIQFIEPDHDPDLDDSAEHANLDEPLSFPPWLFPSLDPCEIEIPSDSSSKAFFTIPQKLCVQGTPLYYKMAISDKALSNSIIKYSKINTSGLPVDKLRTSRLYGIDKTPQGKVRGLFYHWIDIDQTLTWAVDSRTPIALRTKWASQIREAVDLLHSIGVIWGDVKAENVLIDKQGDAVVIDLEGGYSRGWVDKDKADTLEGDLQGMQRLMDYIFNDDSSLRPDSDPEPTRESDDDYEMDDYNHDEADEETRS